MNLPIRQHIDPRWQREDGLDDGTERHYIEWKTSSGLWSSIRLAPYIVKATALIGVKRRAGSNMFRHQISTMGILLDYKIIDPVLLKAAVIHDLFEDAAGMPGVTETEIPVSMPTGRRSTSS